MTYTQIKLYRILTHKNKKGLLGLSGFHYEKVYSSGVGHVQVSE